MEIISIRRFLRKGHTLAQVTLAALWAAHNLQILIDFLQDSLHSFTIVNCIKKLVVCAPRCTATVWLPSAAKLDAHLNCSMSTRAQKLGEVQLFIRWTVDTGILEQPVCKHPPSRLAPTLKHFKSLLETQLFQVIYLLVLLTVTERGILFHW